MNKLYLRVVYAYEYRIQFNHMPSFIQTGIGVIFIPTIKGLLLGEMTKLCELHGKHPEGSAKFTVIASEFVGQDNVLIGDNIIPYDDEQIEEY